MCCKIDITDNIHALSHKIGFNPQNVSLSDKTETEKLNSLLQFVRVNVQQFQKDYNQGEVR